MILCIDEQKEYVLKKNLMVRNQILATSNWLSISASTMPKHILTRSTLCITLTYTYVYRWAVQDDKYFCAFCAFWAWLKLFVLIILLQLWVKLVYLNSESRVKNNIPTLWAQRYLNIPLYNMRVKLLLYTYNFNAIIFNRSICHFRSLAQYSENCSIE